MLTAEQINEQAKIAKTFNYDYQYIDHHNTWLSWHNVRMQQMYFYRSVSVEDKRMILARVAELHDVAVAPYIQYGINKVWAEDLETQKNVRLFIDLTEE